jgi:branched-chain amino acid transport system permease protein
LPLPALILAAGVVGGLVGLALGYLTLRLKGVFFAIATLALSIVIETLVTNWSYVGGAKGSYMLTPESHLWFDSYIQMLFVVMRSSRSWPWPIARSAPRGSAGAWPRSVTTRWPPSAPGCRRCASS